MLSVCPECWGTAYIWPDGIPVPCKSCNSVEAKAMTEEVREQWAATFCLQNNSRVINCTARTAELIEKLRSEEQAGFQRGLEAESDLLKRSGEFLLQWRKLNPSPTSRLGVDTDRFLEELAAAIRQIKGE